MNIPEALTFDDILLSPSYADFLPAETDLRTKLTSKIELNIPFLSAAMDTVTSAEMAIAMAHEGGLGVIHKNQSINRQVSEVARVKTYESGVIKNPIMLESHQTIREALSLANKKHISGFPVMKSKKLIGIVTRRDLRYVEDDERLITEVMTPKERLVVVEEDKTTPELLKELLHRNRIERLLLVDNKKDFNLKGMITVKDLSQTERFPLSCRDGGGSLMVGAAIGVESQRIKPLIEAGVDVIVIDTAHGHSKRVIQQIQRIKRISPNLPVIAGNIATADAAIALAEAGADAVKVGIGPGSICTTRIISGVGFPQVSAIQEVAQALKNHSVGIIADGGIRFSGDVGKAIACGADAVMMGNVFAGTDEAPGEIEYYQGRPYKSYRGMGSIGSMSENHGAAERYSQEKTQRSKLVPEGIEGRLPYKGSVHVAIHQLVGGLKACMGYTGCQTIKRLKTQTRMMRLTHAGMIENHVHDVSITKESPNYRI